MADSIQDRMKSMESAQHAGNPAWKRYPADVVMKIWHLYTGGITSAAHISTLVGRDIKKNTILSIVETGGIFVDGHMNLEKPIRCGECGGLTFLIPCVYCGPPHRETRSYSMPERRHEQ